MRKVPTVPQPRRGRPPKHSKPLLLNVASQALIKRGYANLRYRDVAEEAGVPIASLQHYFPNLATLRREALLHRVLGEAADIDSIALTIADPWERLRFVVSEAIGQDAGRHGEWLVWLEFWRAAAHDSVLRGYNETCQREYRDLFARTIRYGVAQGAYTPECSVEDLAAELCFLIDGIGVRLAVSDCEETAEAGLQIIERVLRERLNLDPAAAGLASSLTR